MVIKKKTSKKTKKAPKKTRRVVKKIYIENPPQPNTIEKITTYVQREKTTVIIVGIILVVIGYFFYNSDTYLKWFGLSHNNTVYDFYNSSDREKLYFMKFI